MSEKMSFVIISFNKKFKNVYDQAIKPALEDNRLIAQKADGEDKVLREIYRDIAEKLVSSTLVIVDISKVKDDDEKLIDLSNVYYELELATAIKKRCIFLTRDEKDIPYDLKNRSAIVYDSDDLKGLKRKLSKKIKMALKESPVDFFEGLDVFNDRNTRPDLKEEKNNPYLDSSEECTSGVLKYLYEIYVFIGDEVKPYYSENISELQLIRLSSLNFINISKRDTSEGPVIYVAMTEKGLKYIDINKSLINY